MKSLLNRVALTCLALGVSSAGYAQEPVPIEFYRPLKNSVSIGVRRIGGNAKVKFSSLGTISSFSAPDLSGTSSRYYHNGTVLADGRSGYELNNTDTDNNGTLDAYQTSSVNTVTDSNDHSIETTTTTTRRDIGGNRYQQVQTVTVKDLTAGTERTTETILGERLQYVEGQTRAWSYNLPSQTGTGTGGNGVDMSIYSSTTSGATAEAESSASPGVEFQFAHIIKRYKRFEWGLNFSAGLSTINAKTRKHIRANLVTTTDRYKLSSGSFANYAYYDSTGDYTTVDAGDNDDGTDITYLSENEHRLGFTDAERVADGKITPNGAEVNGYWQVKGAYYMLRLGPIIRFPIAKNWTISAGAGGAVALVGSRFVVDEYIELPDVTSQIRYQGEGQKNGVVGGYYADVNIERWISVRTGFFAGYSVEKMGDYKHTFDGRKAEIDLGSSGGFRFGIITRF